MSTIEAPAIRAPKEVTTADVLHRAADLLEEFGFCQVHAAEAQDGTVRCVDEIDVDRFCMWGAMVRAEMDFGFNNGVQSPAFAVPAVVKCIGRGWIAWALIPGRTKSEVVALLREAAERSTS